MSILMPDGIAEIHFKSQASVNLTQLICSYSPALRTMLYLRPALDMF